MFHKVPLFKFKIQNLSDNACRKNIVKMIVKTTTDFSHKKRPPHWDGAFDFVMLI
jgi:hypothetical protein